jgi:hypothetical protein
MLKEAGSAGEWLAGLLHNAGVPFAGLIAQAFALTLMEVDLSRGMHRMPATGAGILVG